MARYGLEQEGISKGHQLRATPEPTTYAQIACSHYGVAESKPKEAAIEERETELPATCRRRPSTYAALKSTVNSQKIQVT